MAPARISMLYTGLRVRDLDRSIRFYRRIGFRVSGRGTMQHGGQMVDLALPGNPHLVELNFYPTTNRYYEPFVAGSEFDHLGFRVDHIDAWARQLRRWRIPLVADFVDGTTRLVYARDPDGNWLEFCGPVPAKAAPRRPRG
ncbi:MAG: VOC family protein [Thermoplasmata archaeon]|nr:VOC family protein [Thermoplasmata archaeon]